MKWFTGKSGMTVAASKPGEASLDFILAAKNHGLFLYNMGRFNIADGSFGPHVSYFGDESGKMLVGHNHYLVLLQDEEWLEVNEAIFESLFTPIEGTGELPVEKKLIGKSFYVDPGHGGSDPGAVNNNLGLQEKIAALEIGLLLGKALEAQGGDVYYSRIDDTFPSITSRANEANKLNVDLFVSIHLNSAESESASGVETLVYALNSTAGEIATAVQAQLVKATGFANRGVKSRPDLGVLRLTKMPAILVETGFISNNAEAQKLFETMTQKAIANAICSGIVEVMGS